MGPLRFPRPARCGKLLARQRVDNVLRLFNRLRPQPAEVTTLRRLEKRVRRIGVLRSILAALLLLAGLTALRAQQNEPGALAHHGRVLAEKMCGQCHALGASGASPHIGAPPFRALSDRVDLDTFASRLRDGLTSGHPDMPTFRFSREDARALNAYLRSIQGP